VFSRPPAKAAIAVESTGAAATEVPDGADMLVLDDFAGADRLLAQARAAEIALAAVVGEESSLSAILALRPAPILAVDRADAVNGPLLVALARAHRPILLDAGAAATADVKGALGAIAFGFTAGPDVPASPRAFREAARSAAGRAALADKVTLIFDTDRLGILAQLRRDFGLPVGLRLPAPDAAVAAAAGALGASLIRCPAGEPGALAAMAQAVRRVEALLHPAAAPAPAPARHRPLVARAAIAVGEAFTVENLGAGAPGPGLSPMALWSLLGTLSPRTYRPHDPIDPP
jgi:N-acetylneuraminate synthase